MPGPATAWTFREPDIDAALPPLRLLVPGNIRHSSGGNIYNARLVEALSRLGASIEVVTVDGDWPASSAKDRRRVAGLLSTRSGDSGEAAPITLVDGLIATACPDELESAALARRAPWVLLLMPLCADLPRERRALAAAAGVICPSATAAREVQETYGLKPVVAMPGTEPAPVAHGSTPPHLTVIAVLLPNKAQRLVVSALGQLAGLPWTASLVGSTEADPEYAAAVKADIMRLGLGDRISVTGELTGASLATAWQRSNLSVLVSRRETFGMAVTESLVRGIPAIVRAGTGAEEALTLGTSDGAPIPGAAVGLNPAGGEDEDPTPLADALRRWLTEPDLQESWREAALKARGRPPGWNQAATAVLAAVAPAGLGVRGRS